MQKRGFNKANHYAVWRLFVEWLPGSGEITVRLPFKMGLVFYEPWWQVIFGIGRRGSYGTAWVICWEFLCFSGEFFWERGTAGEVCHVCLGTHRLENYTKGEQGELTDWTTGDMIDCPECAKE